MAKLDIALGEIHAFLRTCTIKNTFFAELANAKASAALYGADVSDETNPYYLNMVGEYSQFDDMMVVTSIDTGNEIEFTKVNLETHLKTKHAYLYPSTYFDQLVAAYPHQSDLIKSILYPVASITNAIDAPHLELLQYDATQLEQQEVDSIVTAIRTYLRYMRDRWTVRAFTTEDLYPAVQWASVWTTLPIVIARQRTENIHTARVHTSHIWSYLQSNGLDDFRSVLSYDQQLFLYRNYQYLRRNRGKDGTLSVLADHLLRPNLITLRSKRIVLNTAGSEVKAVPVAEIVSTDIHGDKTISDYSDSGIESVDQLFKREHAVGLEPSDVPDVIDAHKHILDRARSSVLRTKLVELQRVDVDTSDIETYMQFTLQTLLYRLSRDELDYNITVEVPNSELSAHLTIGEAIALLYYSTGREFSRKVALDADNIDTFVGAYIFSVDGPVEITELNKSNYIDVDVEIVTPPPGDTLVGVAVPETIPSSIIVDMAFKDQFPDELNTTFVCSDRVRRISDHVDIDTVIDRIPTSVGKLRTTTEVLDIIDTQYLARRTDTLVQRSRDDLPFVYALDLLYAQLLAVGEVSFDLGIEYPSYSTWFASDAILQSVISTLNLSQYPNESYGIFASNLLEGIIPVTKSKLRIFDSFTSYDFRRMKELFIRMCSYNITFLDTEIDREMYIRTPKDVIDSDGVSQITDSKSYMGADFDLRIVPTKDDVHLQLDPIKFMTDAHTVSEDTVVQAEKQGHVAVKVDHDIHRLEHLELGQQQTQLVSAPIQETQYLAGAGLRFGIPLYQLIGQGVGLTQFVYNDAEFETMVDVRIIPMVDFDWSTVLPATGLDPDTYSVLWMGYILPEESDTYTLYLESACGVRLSIDDAVVIDDWAPHELHEVSNVHTLVGGKFHRIKLEFYEDQAPGMVKLMWMAGDVPKAVIPQRNLFPLGFNPNNLIEVSTSNEYVYREISVVELDEVISDLPYFINFMLLGTIESEVDQPRVTFTAVSDYVYSALAGDIVIDLPDLPNDESIVFHQYADIYSALLPLDIIALNYPIAGIYSVLPITSAVYSSSSSTSSSSSSTSSSSSSSGYSSSSSSTSSSSSSSGLSSSSSSSSSGLSSSSSSSGLSSSSSSSSSGLSSSSSSSGTLIVIPSSSSSSSSGLSSSSSSSGLSSSSSSSSSGLSSSSSSSSSGLSSSSSSSGVAAAGFTATDLYADPCHTGYLNIIPYQDIYVGTALGLSRWLIDFDYVGYNNNQFVVNGAEPGELVIRGGYSRFIAKTFVPSPTVKFTVNGMHPHDWQNTYLPQLRGGVGLFVQIGGVKHAMSVRNGNYVVPSMDGTYNVGDEIYLHAAESGYRLYTNVELAYDGANFSISIGGSEIYSEAASGFVEYVGFFVDGLFTDEYLTVQDGISVTDINGDGLLSCAVSSSSSTSSSSSSSGLSSSSSSTSSSSSSTSSSSSSSSTSSSSSSGYNGSSSSSSSSIGVVTTNNFTGAGCDIGAMYIDGLNGMNLGTSDLVAQNTWTEVIPYLGIADEHVTVAAGVMEIEVIGDNSGLGIGTPITPSATAEFEVKFQYNMETTDPLALNRAMAGIWVRTVNGLHELNVRGSHIVHNTSFTLISPSSKLADAVTPGEITLMITADGHWLKFFSDGVEVARVLESSNVTDLGLLATAEEIRTTMTLTGMRAEDINGRPIMTCVGGSSSSSSSHVTTYEYTQATFDTPESSIEYASPNINTPESSVEYTSPSINTPESSIEYTSPDINTPESSVEYVQTTMETAESSTEYIQSTFNNTI